MNSTEEFRQRLTAILAADVAGYSRLMAADERGTVTALDAAREVFRSQILANTGRVVDMAGDSVLAVFETATGAVSTAVAVQTELAVRALDVPDGRRMRFRIGVHLGDVIEKPDGTVYGDGVNVAARLEGLARPGDVAVSEPVHVTVRDRIDVTFVDLGEHEIKNIARPVRAFLISVGGGPTPIIKGSLPERAAIKLSNLPAQTTSFLGRERDLSEVITLLGEARLVTLTGVGGIGKTRLSLHAASASAPRFPDGVWLVEFAAVVDPGAVHHAVAGVLGVAQQAGKTIEQSLVESLAERRLLLVLDNCEHLIEAIAGLAQAILAGCTQVKLLATSREALMVDGEQTWPVPSLSFREGSTSPAVELFVERAHAVMPTFRLGEHGRTISEICQRLDGIPLAIELAAARVRAMSPTQIRDRLDERFRLLTGGSRRALERHQTLRHAVQWSYDLLSDTERIVLSRGSVFAGGFFLEAGERVCGGGEVDPLDVLDLLDSLVRKSLVTVEQCGDVVRYGMLETIRQFGEERLAEMGESDTARKTHAQFFAEESDAIFKVWRSPRELEAYEWLDREINNLRTAFRWAIEHKDVDVAARIASNVGDTARFRLREEAANWAEEIVEQARVIRHRRLAVLLTWSASSAWAFWRFDDAKWFGEDAISLRDDPDFDPFVWAYIDLAFVAMFESDIDRAVELLRTGSEHPTDRLDRFCLACLLYVLATAGRPEEARAIADEIVRTVDTAGVPLAIAIAYCGKGAAFENVDPATTLAAYEHALAVARKAGNRWAESLIVPRVAALHSRSGDPVVALHGFEHMLERYGRATDIAFVSAWRASLIVLLAKLSNFEAAATLSGTLPRSVDASRVVAELPDAVARVRDAIGEAAFLALTRRGAAMALREASSYAIEQIGLTLAALHAEPNTM